MSNAIAASRRPKWPLAASSAFRLGGANGAFCVLASGDFDSPIHYDPFDTSHLVAGRSGVARVYRLDEGGKPVGHGRALDLDQVLGVLLA